MESKSTGETKRRRAGRVQACRAAVGYLKAGLVETCERHARVTPLYVLIWDGPGCLESMWSLLLADQYL